MGFRVFHSDLVNVSVHLWTWISAWIYFNLSLRVVGIFKTCQFTLDKQINVIITFSTDDTPPRLPVINNGACIHPILHIFVMFNFGSFMNCLLILLVASRFASIFVVFNFGSFMNCLLILLVASRFAIASILETFVKNIFAFCATGNRQGEPLRQVLRTAVFLLQNVCWLQVYNFYQPTMIGQLTQEPVLIFHILLHMFEDEVNNRYIRGPRRVYLVYWDKRVE